MEGLLLKDMSASLTVHMLDHLIWDDFGDGWKGNAGSKIKAVNLHPWSTSTLIRLVNAGTKARQPFGGVSRGPS